jgi:ABC-type Fe3+-hydroxamate transport system substrate-binding protein
MTEIIYALGAEENLVGATTFCNYPKQTKKLYKVGDFSNPSIERIVSRKPDIVIVNLPEQTRIKKELDKLNIKIFASSPRTLNDIYEEIIEIGRIVDKKKTADSLVGYMKMHITRVDTPDRQRVYVELSPKPLVTVGAPSYLNELLEMAGLENIFADLQKDYPVVGQEQVIKQNPDIIIVLHPVPIKDRMGWQTITPIKNNRVYTHLNQDHLMRPGPRLVIGFEELKKIINE